MKKTELVKVKVEEKDFNFLKKVQGLKEDILIKRVKTKEKGSKEEKEVTSVLVIDDAMSYMVQSTQLTPVFTGEKFGMKNIKAFLKAVTTYGEMSEDENNILFTSGKKKITYRKLDESTIQQITLPAIDTTGYITIPLNAEEIKEIQAGMKNSDLSEYASFKVTTDNNLILQIGEMSYENRFELSIKEIVRKEPTNEIKFLTKSSYLTKLFGGLDADSKTTLYLKAGDPLIFIEKGTLTNVKTIIATALQEDVEENVEKTVDEETEEE